MAIPFNWPSEEDTEEYYRRLDQLLADLYDVLRHILLRPRNPVVHQQPAGDAREDNQEAGEQQGGEPPGGGGGGGEGGDGGDDEGGGGGGGNLGDNNLLEQRLRPLPDLVANTEAASQNSSVPSGHRTRPHRPPLANVPRHPPRRHRNHRRSSSPRTKSCCALRVSNSLKTSAENWVLVGKELRKIAEEFRTSCRKEEKTKLSEAEQQVEVKASSLFSLLVPAPFSGPVWTTVILLVGWRLFMRNR